LATNTPPNAVVLFRGDWKGLLEFAAPLLQPRWLYAAGAVAPETTTVHGRPLARGRLAAGAEEGVVVLVAEPNEPLRLERLW
jgi:hypothetical protein